MKLYTCPMHPEIEQSNPGRCPHCGMKLVLKNELSTAFTEYSSENSYRPLVVIIGLILITSIVIDISQSKDGTLELLNLVYYFMIGFFLTFSGFKLIDLEGFAQAYSTYDLLAKRLFAYGYIYPFIELFFGLGMILMGDVKWLLWAEIIVMTFSGIGVAWKLWKKERFQCACLGTFLKVPLTKVTLIEDFGMAILAALMLYFS